MPSPIALLAAPAGFAIGGVLSRFAPNLIRRRAVVERRVLALASAGAAALWSNASPTGVTAVDVLYRALFAALLVHLGSRAKREVVLTAAVIAAAAAWWSPVLPIALAALGLAAGVFLTSRRTPLVSAIVAAAIGHTILNLHLDHQGVSALAAAAAAVPLLISGARRSNPRERKRIGRTTLAAAALATLATAAAGLAAVLAAGPLQRGVDAASEGLATARDGDATASNERFATAGVEFADASSTLGPWTAPARLVPIVSQHVHLARTVAAAGERLASTGASTAAAANVDRLQVTDGAIDLAATNALRIPLRNAAASASSARDDFDRATSDWTLTPLKTRLRTEIDRLARAERDATRAADVLDRLPSIFGGDGTPRRYFILIQTPAESRALGGFVGSYGELVADNGRLSLTKFGRTRELQTAGTPQQRQLAAPADYVARYARFDPAVTWQNVTMSPDGPTVAQVVASLYPQSGGSPVDGTIVIDPGGLAALLKLTGPVTVAPWPEPLTADNAEQILLVDQYVRLEKEQRENFLGDVAETVVRRLTSGTLPRPKALVDALSPVARQGHLAFVSLVEQDAELAADLDLDLAMPKVDGDFLALVTQNASSNKIDTFLRRAIAYDVDIDDDGRLTATATVELRNEAPAEGLPDYIIGNQVRLPKGFTRLYVSVYSPWAMTKATVDGAATTMESENELNRRVYSRYVEIGPGETRTLTLELTGTYDRERYVLDVRHQPGTVDDVQLTVKTDNLDFRVTRDLEISLVR